MFRLSSKIVLAFSIIIITGSILMVTIINTTTRAGYRQFAKNSDVKFSEKLIDPLKEYYSQNNSWDGVENFLKFPKPRMGEMMEGRGRSSFPPVILTDKMGRILVNTQKNDNRKFNKEQLEHGIEIKYKNRVVGYIFTGSMIVAKLTLEEEKFLNNITAIIIMVTLFILVISIIFSYYFSKRVTKPISKLSQASKQVESGNYKTRVEDEGSDEISQLSKSFNNMVKSLENSDNWRKQIIADSAHELRTPVTLIQGNLEMILDGVYKADNSHIQNIYDETLVLSRLIKELQQLSSAESGSMSLNIDKLNINNLIDNTLEIFNAGKSKDKIELINSIKTNLPLLDGDEQKLKQVFSNILANAYRHTPAGGKIEISAEKHSRKIVIKIKDTGSGVPQKDLKKIFERFYRTDSSRNRSTGGSGLGLAISREIVRLHRGSIHAESENQDGTTIIIKLPI